MRYVPITSDDKRAMLADIGVPDTDALFADIPPAVRLNRPLDLPAARSEMEIMTRMTQLAGKNVNLADFACFLGCGAYDHYIPSVVDHMIRRGEFYTAYTPYQPEISQGTLQVIYEYQSLVCELTGMDLANASLYDGASALAEAAIIALRQTDRKTLLVARSVHPQWRRVLRTYTQGLDCNVVEVPLKNGAVDLDALRALMSDDVAGVLVQHPNFFGCLEPVHEVGELAHSKGSMFTVAADPISLGALEAPGRYGADIVVCEGQSLGQPVAFGGPYLGILACKEQFSRRIPGRIVGATLDSRGQRAYVLTLQAREQHIRREKATSNVCTNEALNALMATVYLTWLGKQGLTEVANLCLQKAHYAQQQISKLSGWQPAFPTPFFKEFTVKSPVSVAKANAALLQTRIFGGYAATADYPELGEAMILCVTEKRTRQEIDDLIAGLGGVRQ